MCSCRQQLDECRGEKQLLGEEAEQLKLLLKREVAFNSYIEKTLVAAASFIFWSLRDNLWPLRDDLWPLRDDLWSLRDDLWPLRDDLWPLQDDLGLL